MLDIPFFTTQLGVASLTLSQIPYTSEAYIRIQDTAEPALFLAECVEFCKAAGANLVYATGHSYLDKYELHTAIWQMSCPVTNLNNTDLCLFPVQEATSEQWREIYNQRMNHVPNAAYMTKMKLREIISAGSAYYVHKDGDMYGIGIASGGKIDAIVATQKGSGYEVLCALCGALSEDIAEVEVASVNAAAVRLYERAGFIKTKEISTWYKII